MLKEHFFCILSMLTRLVGLISAKTIGYFFPPPFILCNRSIERSILYLVLTLSIHKIIILFLFLSPIMLKTLMWTLNLPDIKFK